MLTQFFRWSLVVVVFSLVSFGALAQDEPTLVPVTDTTMQYQGVRPDAWTNPGNGLFVRGSSATDPTVLALQAVPFAIDTVMTSILPQYGLTETPESTGTREGALSWTLYHFEGTQGGATLQIDLAMANTGGRTYIVLVQTTADDYDALHESVFLPAVDAMTPIVATEEAVPYQVEAVTFENGDVTLAGTLTLPEGDGPFPAIAMMTGSGPQTRDEEVVPGFPIFKQIADYLTRRGIAVLRYDDRGVGESTGDYVGATIQDFASDGQAAVDYLHTREDILADQIGVFGHSEGGIYAAMLGADPDSGIAFIVSLAGTAVGGRDVLIRQNELMLQSQGASDELVQSQLTFLNALFDLVDADDPEAVARLARETALEQWELLSDEMREARGVDSAEEYAAQIEAAVINGFSTDWFASLLDYNPADDWARTTVPVLAIYGSADVQVDDEQNAPPMQAALDVAGNTDATVVTLEGANHLFQMADTGSTAEYFTLPHEFVPDLLPTMGDWLVAHTDAAG